MLPKDVQLLRIRPSLPDKDDISSERGPLMMETVLSSLHSLKGKDARMSLEIGFTGGKGALFTLSTENASSLIESQLSAQFPDAETAPEIDNPFEVKPGEVVL